MISCYRKNAFIHDTAVIDEKVGIGKDTKVWHFSHVRRMDEVRPTRVKKGASLGANCTIVCGVTIGEYALVGAGAVVTKDVPGFMLISG